MPKYLNETVENGVPYNDILEVHNRLIAAGKLIRFFYRFIKDYTQQIANAHSITIDWQYLPDDVPFDYSWLNYGDSVNYLNDLVNLINNSKRMLEIALQQWTTFFKFWLSHLDVDNDSLADLVVGDTDIHNKPSFNNEEIFLSWSAGDVIYAEDFNVLKESAFDLIKAMKRVFGAYYNLIKLEGLDTKSSEFANYGVELNEHSLTFSNLISNWTRVDPYPIEEGATIFYEYEDDWQWNSKVIVWKSADGTAHRFTIWDYFEQKYVFDSGWYPAQDYPTDYPKPTSFNSWKSGFPKTYNHIFYRPSTNEIFYVTFVYGHFLLTTSDEGLLRSYRANVINYETGQTRVAEHYSYLATDYFSEYGFYHLFKTRGTIGLVYDYEKLSGTTKYKEVVFSWMDSNETIKSTTVDSESGGTVTLQIDTFHSNYVSHYGSRGINFWLKLDDTYDEVGTINYIFLSSESNFSITRLFYVVDNDVSYASSNFFTWGGCGPFKSREDYDDNHYIGAASSFGSAQIRNDCGGYGSSYVYSAYKLAYGMILSCVEYTCDSREAYYGAVVRLDYPRIKEKGCIQNVDGNHPVEWTPQNYGGVPDFIMIKWKYPEIKWLLPVVKYYNIQNPRVFQDAISFDSSGVAYIICEDYFVPKTWYAEPYLYTQDIIAHNDGVVYVNLNYWGSDAEKMASYDVISIRVM